MVVVVLVRKSRLGCFRGFVIGAVYGLTSRDVDRNYDIAGGGGHVSELDTITQEIRAANEA